METRKVLTFVFSGVFILAFIGVLCWGVINFNKVKDSMSGSQLYNSEDLHKSYQDGYDTALKDKEEYEVLINSYRDTITNLNDTISSLNSQIANLNSNNLDYKNQVQRLNEQKDLLNTQVEQLKANQVENGAQIDSLNNQITSLNTEITSLNNIISNNENTINGLNSQIEGLNTQILGLNQTITTNEQTISDLRVTINELNNEIEELSGDMSKNETTIRLLNNEIDSLNEQIDSINQINNDYLKSITKLNNEIEMLKSEKNDLIIENNNYYNTISSLNNQVVNLQNVNTQLENTNTLHLNTISNLNTQIASLNAQINDITLQSQNNNSTIASLNAQINELKDSVAYYENYIASLETGDQIVVTFEFDGSVYNIQMVTKGSKLSVTTPTSTDYVIFNSWEVGGETIDLESYEFNQNTKVVADVTYKYDAVFKVDNAIHNSQIIVENGVATLPANPVKAGYEFDGWSLDGVNVVNVANTQIKNNITFYAVFTKLYNVSFVYEGVTKSTQVVRSGELADNISIDSTSYKVFNGWKVNDSIVNVTNYKIVADTTFVADITYKYDVVFKVDDNVYNSQIIAMNNYPSLPANPVKEGYAFDGWSINGVDIVNTSTISISANTVYKAVFTKLHTATFDYEGVIISSQEIRENGIANVANINSTPYKVFNGWKVNGEFVDVANYPITSDTIFIADITYKHDIVFNVNNETYNTQIVAENTSPTLPNEPVRDGYAFDGWSLDGINIIDVSAYKVTNGVIFTAMFTKTYTVVFMYENKSISNQVVRTGLNAVSPSVDNTVYKQFNGWKIGNNIVDVNAYAITENTTFVADITYSYDVTFTVDGSVYDTQIVVKNQSPTLPESPSKIDYEFIGWSTDGVNVVDMSTQTIQFNTTYIAVFNLITGGLYNHTTGEKLMNWRELEEGGYVVLNDEGVLSAGANVTSLEGDLELTDKVVTISSGTFEGCSGLTEVIIPDSVTTICSNAFKNCTEMSKIYIPASVTTLSKDVFDGRLFENLAYGFTIYCESATKGSNWNGYWSNFYNSYASYPVYYGVTRDDYNQNYDIVMSGIKYLMDEVNSRVIPLKLVDNTITVLELDSRVTEIPQYTFRNCTSFEILNIHEGITKIDHYAFSGCLNVREINLPSTLTILGVYALARCELVTEIVLPDSLTEIGGSCLSGMRSLKKLTVPFVGNIKNPTKTSSSTMLGMLFGSSVVNMDYFRSEKQYYSAEDYSQFHIPKTLEYVHVKGGILRQGALMNLRLKTLIIENVTGIYAYALRNSAEKIYIDETTEFANMAYAKSGPFVYPNNTTSIPSNINVYCARESAPTNWGQYYNSCTTNNDKIPFNWGYTLDEFMDIVEG